MMIFKKVQDKTKEDLKEFQQLLKIVRNVIIKQKRKFEMEYEGALIVIEEDKQLQPTQQKNIVLRVGIKEDFENKTTSNGYGLKSVYEHLIHFKPHIFEVLKLNMMTFI